MSDAEFGAITVMVVDDADDLREIVAGLLKAVGVGRVLLAKSGVEAIGQLAETPGSVDIILCDIEMPEMTGFEFTRRVRYGTVPAFKDVPIIIITGRSSDAYAEKARVHKISGYLAKPLSIDMLKLEIRNALGLS